MIVHKNNLPVKNISAVQIYYWLGLGGTWGESEK